MIRIYNFSLILSLLFFFSSCTSSHNSKYHPVRNHKPRVSTLGFQILPPPGLNWYEKRIDESLHYLKKIKPHTYALTTTATELSFKNTFTWENDFLEFVKTHKKIHKGPSSHYRNCSQRFTVEEILTGLCIRYQNKYDDYGDKGKGNYGFVKVVNNGLICQHPESPAVGIDISYLEKSIPQANNPSFRDEGEKFLNSLSFLPL